MSLKLKRARREIETVLARYDVCACITLASESNNEFFYRLDSNSCGDELAGKLYDDSLSLQSNFNHYTMRTFNQVREMAAYSFVHINTTIASVSSRFGIEFKPHSHVTTAAHPISEN